MNNELTLYARSKNNIWTDKWIAQNMLSAHLNLHNDAASRNIHVIHKTIEWITKVIKNNAAILDLGCGPGLYTEALFKKGYTVTGLDISKHSIRYAQKSSKKNKLDIDYICRNYVKDKIPGNYDCALCIYCDFGALIPDEQKILLRKIYDSLNSGGMFIFDVFGNRLSDTRKNTKSWEYFSKGSFWSKHAHYLLSEGQFFEQQNAWGSRNIVIEKHRKREYITWDTMYTEDKIKELLLDNGFEVEEIVKNLVEQNDFTSNDVLFIRAKKI